METLTYGTSQGLEASQVRGVPPGRTESRQRATVGPPGAWQCSLILDVVDSLELITLLRDDSAFILLQGSISCDFRDVHICHLTLVRSDESPENRLMCSHATFTSKSPVGIPSPCPLTVAAVTDHYKLRG